MTRWIRQAALIATVECRLQINTAAWRIMLLLSVVLAGTMTTASLQDYTRRQNEVDVLVVRRDQAREHGQHKVSGFQRDEALRVIRSPAPLSAVVTGLDKRIPQYWDFGPEGITAGSAASGEAAATVASADLDLEFILRGLIGMLALVAGVGSMVASKQGGGTKSLVSLPVRPSALVVGAMVGGTVAVAMASAVVVASTVAMLLMGNAALVLPDGVWSLVMIWLASTLYGATLVGTGAAVALVVPNTSRAVATIAVLWLVTAMIAGPIIGAVADVITPNKSRTLFEIARNSEYEKEEATVETDAGSIVLQHLEATDIPREFQLGDPLLDAVQQHWNRSLKSLRSRLDDLESGFRENKIARARKAWWLGTIFPGTAFGYAATELAGVGEAGARRWIEDAEAYHRALSAAVFDVRPRLYMRVRSGSGYRVEFHDRTPEPTVDALPVFYQNVVGPLIRARDAGPSIATLALQCSAVWLAAIVIFIRRQSSPDGWH